MRTRILLSLVVAVVLSLVVSGVWVSSEYTPTSCDYAVNVTRLREVASSIPGDKPKEIRVEHVSNASFPKALVVAGRSWKSAELRVYAYQLVFADKTVMIDTAMNSVQAQRVGMADGYDAAAWARVVKAMSNASAIYVTHEHEDHLGGAVAVKDAPYLARVHLNPEQRKGGTPSEPEMSPETRAALTSLPYQDMVAVAPGVVLIRAPGHTPGSQMVYVQRADGVEVLLAGDAALLMDSIEFEQGPNFLVTMKGHGDRSAVACTLIALNQLRKGEGRVAIMPGHDGEVMESLVARDVFAPGFR
jgi:glyoxylase-like metal-dependent hydrolase (beta-lactamase superfamily II)